MAFKKATKAQSRLRMALDGPSGSGKTFTALSIAKHLGSRIALIDTERGSASKYASDFDFDVCELQSFSPANYIAQLHEAGKAGYDVVIVDSLSHAWTGQGGCLDQVDAVASMAKGNTYVAWRKITPQHNALIDAILQSPCHVIVTMRTKTEYVMETNERGKQTPRKVGLAPVQREGMEYEFDVVGDIDLDHRLMVSKTRCAALDGYACVKDGEKIAGVLKAWLSDGDAPPQSAAGKTEAKPSPIEEWRERAENAKTLEELRDLFVKGTKELPPELQAEWQAIKDIEKGRFS